MEQLQWNTNRDLHTPYSRVSFRMTLSDVGAIFDDTKHCVVSLRQLMSCDTQHCVVSFSATADVLWHTALCRFILWDSWCLVTQSTVSFLCDSWCLVTQSTVSFHSLRQLMSCIKQFTTQWRCWLLQASMSKSCSSNDWSYGGDVGSSAGSAYCCMYGWASACSAVIRKSGSRFNIFSNRSTATQTDRQLQRDTDRQVDRQTDRQLQRDTDKQSHRDTDRELQRDTDRQVDRDTDRQTDRQLQRDTDRQVDRDTDRQIDSYRETLTNSHTETQTDRQTVTERHWHTGRQLF